MAKKKTGKARKKPTKAKAKAKDLSPKPSSTRMVVGGRRAQIST